MVNFTTISMLTKLLKIFGKILAGIVILLIIAWTLIHFSPVQTWLVRKAANTLSKELNTKVEVGKVDFSVFKKIILEGVYIEDQRKDTLLYAGRISVRFNNWFILKNNTIIHEANLEHAKIYLHRIDSNWNYIHIENYFTSGKSQNQKKNKPPKIALKELYLSDIHFHMKDEWIGEDIKTYIGELTLLSNQLEIDKKNIDIKKINLRYPSCSIYEYEGKRPAKKKYSEAQIHSLADTMKTPFLEGWKCKIDEIDMKEGVFVNILDTIKPADYFDPYYIVFNNINASIKDMNIVNDSILARLQLSTKERSGFEIKALQSEINWHSRAMEFHKLKIETPYSTIGNFFAMRYLRFYHDMNEFIDHVKMDGNFLNSKIHSKDLSYFAPALNAYNESLFINGSVSGTVDNLFSEKLSINNGKKTFISGKARIKGLPETDKLKYDIYLNSSQIEYNYLSRIIPEIKEIKQPLMSTLGNFGVSGLIAGSPDSLKVDLSLSTAIGNLTTILNFHLPKNKIPSYKGTIQTDNFNLGKFIQQSEIGTINMNTEINGSDFTWNKMALDIKSDISSLVLNNQSFKNIKLSASIKDKVLSFSTIINDNGIDLNLASIINLKKTNAIQYKLGGSINNIDLHKFGLLQSPLCISGNIDADFKATGIKDFIGQIALNNLIISDGNKNFPLNYIEVKSEETGIKTKKLTLQSDILNLNLNGVYTLNKIPDLGKQILSVYFPSYFTKEQDIKEMHDFEFDLETKNIDDLLSLFNLPIKGGNESKIKGKINTLNNLYQVEANVPNFTIRNIKMDKIYILSDNNNTQFNLNGEIGMIHVSDSLKIPDTKFTINGAADTGFISIKTAMSQTFKNADLRSYFKVTKEGILLNFLKSNFVLNEKIWSIENESDLFLGSSDILSDGIIITSGNESIKIFTHPSDIGLHNDITIELRKIELGELIPLFLKDPIIEGTTTGRIDITDPFGNYHAEGKLTTERFRMNNDSVGLVPLQVSYKQKEQVIRYSLSSDNYKHIFKIKGYTNISNTDSIYTDNTIELSQQSLSLIEPYMEDIISKIEGTGTGILRAKGYIDDIKILGNIKLNDAAFLLDYTNCRYQIQPGAIIEFSDDRIDFVNILVKDIKGKLASFTGKITHSFFNDMVFDLHFEAMNKNRGILVLNTTKKDNSLFYGNVTAYTNGTITGPANNIKMKISGRPTDSSKLYLPTSDSRVTGTANFIVFRQYGEDLETTTKIQNSSSVGVDLDIIANPYAKVYLILDEITNDVIEGQGNGTINLKVGTNENVSITGNYEITSGKYTFNWQSLFKRPFLINKGTINWSGNPYDARINIDANYMVEQVRLPAELTNGCSDERNNIIVVANLSNTLKNPSIKFRFELPQGHPCRNNPLTNNGLAQLYNNPDELNRQVISLLLIGSFISNSQNQSFAGGSVGNTFVTSAAGTLSEFLAQQVESGLGAVIRNIPGLKDLKLDPYVTFTPGLITSTQAEGIGFQGTGSFGFTRRLMNGKLLLKAGGSMLVATGQNNTAAQNNRQLTPDISIEWLITPDGKLRLIGFYRTIFDIQRRNDRTGVSFSYLQEFDKIW